MNPREQHDAVLAKARELATKADGRDFTPEELAAAAELKRQAGDLEPKVKQWEDDQATKAFINDLGASIGHDTATDAPGSDGQPIAKDAGTAVKTAERPEWATAGRPRSDWVKATLDRVEKVTTASGRKAVISGTIEVGAPIQSGIDRLPQYPTRLLDLLVNRVPLNQGNTFSWYQQVAQTNNAAPVADSATKPTSVYSFGEMEGRVRVLAHLSEAIPERFLSDYTDLADFLESEMEEGLHRAVEAQVVSGNGAGENFTGLLSTSGLLVQAWNANLLTTLRKASTALEVTGQVPNAWCINPLDVETLDLLTDNEARYYYAGPSQQIGPTNPVWSLPIVKSVAVPAGTAILGNWNYIRLVVREDARLDIDRSGVLFEKNQFKARVECRMGVAVLRPGAFVQVATAAP